MTKKSNKIALTILWASGFSLSLAAFGEQLASRQMNCYAHRLMDEIG